MNAPLGFLGVVGCVWLFGVSASFAQVSKGANEGHAPEMRSEPLSNAEDLSMTSDEDLTASRGSCGWDVVLGHGALPAASGVDTQVQTRFGLRIRNRQTDATQWFWGREATLWGHGDNQGTAAISVKRGLVGVDGRLVRGFSSGTRLFRVAPFTFVQLGGSMGFSQLQVGTESRIRPLGSLAIGTGVGLEYQLGAVEMRIELGVGLRNHQLELLSGLSLGWGEVPIKRQPNGSVDEAIAEGNDRAEGDVTSPPLFCLAF